jgi:hypothetical protein
MGGAVVVHTIPHLLEAKYRVSGVVVLDVVEGTALDALPHMPAVLNSRPEGFDSVSDAIEWQYVPSIPYCTPLIYSMHCVVSLRTRSVMSLLPECQYLPLLSLPPIPERVGRVRFPGVRHCAPQDRTGEVRFSPIIPCSILTAAHLRRLVQGTIGGVPCCAHRASVGTCRYRSP